MQTADVLHVEQNLSVVPMNSSSLTKACEIFRYEEGKYVMPQSAADYLTSVISERTQFSVVSIIGTYRKGKSTFLNFLQQSEYPNPFNVSSKAYACTKGIWGWYDTTHNILYLDVEGSDAPTMTKAKWCEYRMNALAVMLSSVLLYWHWEGAISSNLGTLNALCLFAERLRAFTHEGGTQGLELHLPALLWLFRNWEDSGIDIVPSREYVKEQVGLVDETLAEYLDQFPAFVALDLPRPVNGRMTPEVLEDHTNQTEEYRDRLKDIQGILGIHKAQKVWTSPKTFITLCRGLEYVVNQEDFVPTSLSHACSAARDALMDEVRAHALGIYTTSIEKIEIPITDTQLQKALDEASAQAKSHFRRNMLGVIKEEAIEHYALDLEPEFQRRCVALKKMNRDQSVIHCQSLIPGLQAYYYNEMNAVELPYPEDALRATHERLLDEVLKRYDKLATGSHEVRAEYRSEFQNALTSVFHERAHLNASEIACSQIVPKAHNVFVQQCNSVFTQTVMSDDAIVTFLEEAHQKAVAYYHTETKSYHPSTVHIHEQELEKLTRKDFQTVTSNNALRAQQVVMQQLPYMIMYYRDTMTSRLAADILPGDALQRIHTETMTETFKKMSDFCAPFCSPPVSNALHQPSVINEHVRTAEVALKDELQAQYKTFEKSNSTRAHELAQRLVDVSHTVYEKNMRLVIQPVSSNILESAHYDNQLTALENFLSKAVGSLEEIHTFENRLRDMINRTYLKIRLENAITSNEGFLMKRSRFLLAWYGRYFILAEGLLKVFDLSTLEKKLIDTVPVSSIEEVTYSDVLPSKKGSEDAQKEIEEARSLHGRSLSMNSEPRSAVRMRDSECDIEQWEYGLMIRAVNHHTMYLVAGTERDREVWFLALRNACGLQT